MKLTIMISAACLLSLFSASSQAETMNTRIGALQFTSGYPTEKSVQKLCDELDFQRAVQAYLVDAEGQPLNASTSRYTMTFAEGQLPPVKAFWSLTMYDGATQLFIDNPLDRYLLNSTMMEQFQVAEDGTLTLNIQKDSPGKGMESNWLPAPDGPFYMVLRLYGPEAAALEGVWTPPPAVLTN